MNFLFLDVDGVLNYSGYDNNEIFPLSLDIINRLSQIVKKYNFKIVLSSDWKTGFEKVDGKIIAIQEGYEESSSMKLDRTLKKYDIEIFDLTEQLFGHSREDEIKKYISDNLSDNDFYIIIDDYDMSKTFGNHFIKTNYYGKGFDIYAENKLIKIMEE